MRDPARIPRMLDALRRAWERSPDLRLGQLVSNAARHHGAWPDVFSVEDDDLLRGLVSSLPAAPHDPQTKETHLPCDDPAP